MATDSSITTTEISAATPAKRIIFNESQIIDKDQNSSATATATTATTTVTADSTLTTSNNGNKFFDYSYVVLIASFVAYMLAALLSSCFGVFFDSMASDLSLSKSQVAFIGACLSALDNLLGPISSAFINRYGCRKTCIIGGLFASIGIIASSYVDQFLLIGLFMGFVSGFGTSLVLVSTVVIVTYYFEDKPSFASGFVISGGSFGQSIFSLIIIKLNEVYGRSGCFLILGGLLLNIVVCGALFRPLDWELEDYVNEEEDDGEEEIDEEIGDLDEDDINALGDVTHHGSEEIEKADDNFFPMRDIDLPLIYDLNMCEKFSYNDIILDKNTFQNQIATDLLSTKTRTKKPKKATLLTRFKNLFKFKKSTEDEEDEDEVERGVRRPIYIPNTQANRIRSYSISTPLKPRSHHNHHHHHHHHYHHPNLPDFANAYRLPLYLRNFYYKSLINLNTRLMADKSPLTQSKNALIKDLKQQRFDDLDSNLQLSLSCPNLNTSTTNTVDHLTVYDLNYRLNKYRDLMQIHLKNKNKPKVEAIEDDEDVKVKKNFVFKFFRSIQKLFKRLFNSIASTFKLFHIVPFTIFALCNFILSLFYEAPFYFINSYMIENGFTQNNAGMVTVAIGVTAIFAAIAYGYIGDLKRLNWIIVYSVSLLVTGVCNFIIPFCIKHYMLTLVTMVFNGVFISVNDVLVPIICVNIVGCDDFVSAYGLILFCQGISSLMGPPLLGMIVDYAGNYAYAYNICGIGMCLSGFILLTILIHNKCRKNADGKEDKENRIEEESVTDKLKPNKKEAPTTIVEVNEKDETISLK